MDGGMAVDPGRDSSLSVLRHSELGSALCHRRAGHWVPIAMLLAWLYEFTGAGFVRDEDVDPGVRKSAGRLLDFYNYRCSSAANWSAALWPASVPELER